VTALSPFSNSFLWSLTTKLDWLGMVGIGLRLDGPKMSSLEFMVKLKGDWEAAIDVNSNCKGISIAIPTLSLPCPMSLKGSVNRGKQH